MKATFGTTEETKQEVTNTPTKTKRKEIGAVWEKQTQNGSTFLKIKLTKGEEVFWFNAFLNNFKTDNSHPKFVIFEDRIDDVGTVKN